MKCFKFVNSTYRRRIFIAHIYSAFCSTLCGRKATSWTLATGSTCLRLYHLTPEKNTEQTNNELKTAMDNREPRKKTTDSVGCVRLMMTMMTLTVNVNETVMLCIMYVKQKK